MSSHGCTKTSPLSAPKAAPPLELVELTSGSSLSLSPRASPYVVGSAPGCDLLIDDPFVSASHCAVVVRADALELRDLQSKNGTFVGTARIERARIGVGARLRLGQTVVELRSSRGGRGFTRLVGSSAELRGALSMARRAAPSDCSVLILGETGTGKELVARAIHESSPRSGGPFVALNCGAIPRELVAAELFGHVRGAFTGAIGERDGVFASADGGSLFLDELGELPAEQQPHLLRVLETSRVTPVGSHQERPVAVRLIAATNVLDVGGLDSPLRPDLYHRLATVVVDLPPLRERRTDIPELVRHFMRELEGRYGPREITETTMAALARLPWPGNIRELRQAVHRATALCTSELTLDGLVPPRLRETMSACPGALDDDLLPVDRAVRDMMLSAYQRYGTIRRAAASLGMPKSTFADKAHRYGILPRR